MKKEIIVSCICVALFTACGTQAEQTNSDYSEISSETTFSESASETTTTEQRSVDNTESVIESTQGSETFIETAETTTIEQTSVDNTESVIGSTEESESCTETAENTTTVNMEMSDLVLRVNNTGEKQYSWHVKPTIEAKHIDNIERSRTYWGDYLYDTTWYSRFFFIMNADNESAVIDIDGNVLTDYIFDTMCYCSYGCVLEDYDNPDNPWNSGYAGCTLYDDGTISDFHYDEYYQEATNGYGELFITDLEDKNDNKIILFSDGGIDRCVDGPAISAFRRIHIVKSENGSGFQINAHRDETYWPEYNRASDKYALVSNIWRAVPITDFIYEDKGNFMCEVIPMKKDGKWGYIDRYGNTVIPFEYDAAWLQEKEFPFEYRKYDFLKNTKARDASEYYVVLCKNGEYALVTTAYEEVIPFGEFDYITSVFQGKAWVKDKDSGLWGVIKIER